VIAKFARAHAASATGSQMVGAEGRYAAAQHLSAADPVRARAAADKRSRELLVQAAAVPSALLAARVCVAAAPGAVRLLTMWVHESGHALAAWACGYAAWPGPWFTPVSEQRSPAVAVLWAALLLAGGSRLWRDGYRRTSVALGVLGAAIVGAGLALPESHARQVITFGGDAGCFVLGAALMATAFAPADSALRRNGVCWGLAVLGALAFVDAWVVWSGPLERLPFGENENGLSDPSVLVEIYGWSIAALVERYLTLARWCLGVLCLLYALRVWRAAGEARAADSGSGGE
jgi:hypothetical protein